MSFHKSTNTAGGLAKLFLLRLAHYRGIKWAAEHNSYALYYVGSYLQQIYLTPDTIGYTVKRKSGAYDIKIKGIFPGSTNAFEELEVIPFVLLGLTHNNEYLLFGDTNNYFIYDIDQDSGSDFTDLAQTNFELNRSMMLKPRVIRNPFIIDPPKAFEVNIDGLIKVGGIVLGIYTFYDDNLLEQNSIFSWYISDDIQGTNKTLIYSGLSYNILSNNEGKYLQFSVIPRNTAGITGVEYFSNNFIVESSVTYFQPSYYFPDHYFITTILDSDTDHYIFQSVHGWGTDEFQSWYFLFTDDPFGPLKPNEWLYFQLEYKVNYNLFFGLVVWPMSHDLGYLGTTGKEIEYSSKIANQWVIVTGRVKSNEVVDKFRLNTEYIDRLPESASLEIRNLKYYRQ